MITDKRDPNRLRGVIRGVEIRQRDLDRNRDLARFAVPYPTWTEAEAIVSAYCATAGLTLSPEETAKASAVLRFVGLAR